MPEAESLVFVVDDDPAIRESLKRLFKSVGMAIGRQHLGVGRVSREIDADTTINHEFK